MRYIHQARGRDDLRCFNNNFFQRGTSLSPHTKMPSKLVLLAWKCIPIPICHMKMLTATNERFFIVNTMPRADRSILILDIRMALYMNVHALSTASGSICGFWVCVKRPPQAFWYLLFLPFGAGGVGTTLSRPTSVGGECGQSLNSWVRVAALADGIVKT